MRRKVSQRSASSSLQDTRADRPRKSSDRGRSRLRRSGLLTVACVDQLLRCYLQIHEFTDQADCVLRISKSHASSHETLSDGVEIAPGDPVLELHLWNEHLDVVGRDCPVFTWGVELLKRLRFSLMLLADHVEMNEEWASAKAVHARFATCLRRPDRGFRHLGFTVTSPDRSLGRRAHDFFEAFLVHGLIWAFRPCATRRHPKNLKRMELWLSISSLRRLYGRHAVDLEQRVCSTPDFLYEAINTSNLSKGSQHETVLGTSQL
jgi:hypothetical protein